jgi:hypothetical protein
MRIRLVRKLAESLNGIDVSAVEAGEEIDLEDAAAVMLIMEGWAEPSAEAPGEPPISPRTKRRARW